MEFKILDRFEKPAYNAKSRAYLIWDNWNDFSFLTLFGLIYVDEHSVRHEVGSVKIGFFGQGESERKLTKGDIFEVIYADHFSLGQSDDYYANLNELGDDIRDEILLGLKDIAKDVELYNRAISEKVTKVSLLRFISPISVTGQFRRMANGLAALTDYNFDFITPSIKGKSGSFSLSFSVLPESMPPTNVHVIIGRNGVGKTNLLNNMINCLILEEADKTNKFGRFKNEDTNSQENLFANLISVSFSAFDESEPTPERKDKSLGIQYSYIGLKRIQAGNEKKLSPKSTTILRNEFFNSLNTIRRIKKAQRWKLIIEMLESDPIFQESEIKSLADVEGDEEFKNTAYDTFKRLSSGHKIVLLTITRLVESLQERSLVLIDEPEAHLHPPLLSAFIRTLSTLLNLTNGVAIIATHSPVILQEVPKNCVWKLRRAGASATAERLAIESFGENVGVLTNEIFSLEINKSGYYRLVNEAIETNATYDEVVRYFDDKLGMEARAIIMAILSNRE